MRQDQLKNSRLKTFMPQRGSAFLAGLLLSFSAGVSLADDEYHPEMGPQAEQTKHSDEVFSPDPDYADEAYDAEAQIEIYGGKKAVHTPRPLLELGRPQYQAGPLTKTSPVFGERNRTATALAVYGDIRTAVAFNDNNGRDFHRLAARANFDIDLKITGTERIHAFVRPLDRNNQFSGIDFGGDTDGINDELLLDGNLETLFFEGDFGSIWAGLSGKPSNFDLPFAVGKMPLLFQNGVWMEDAFTGFAFTIPARNSRLFDISNFDITFFAGFDDVSSQAIRRADGTIADDEVHLYGVASFWELLGGYAEVDYAFIDAQNEFDDLDHHNFSASFTKRISDFASTSVRVMSTFGQDPIGREKTAGGTMVMWENSLITSKPSTYIPYMNLFAGFDRPLSVARDNGGLLKTIGINFETDGLTGFPTLDDSGHDAYGGAIGLNYLFGLDKQIVLEFAGLRLMDRENPLGTARDDQVAIGFRYQEPLNRSVIFRFDAIKGWRDDDDNISGIRMELRRKF
ncbi:MAG: hypothetical protein HKN50_07220 [Gammaproteobacteria bacterium]|nr:hypothetical protein [Gammaproteobacteria bacterium]